MKIKMLNKAFGYNQDARGVNLPGKWFEKGEVYEMSESLASCFVSTKDAKEVKEAEAPKKEAPKKDKPKK